CEKYVKGYPEALYKSFYTKIEAQNFIDQQNIDDFKDVLNVWTDGYCKRNGLSYAIGGIGVFFRDNDIRNLSERLPGERQTNNRAEIYTVIRALEICDKKENLIINTDSNYVIISRDIKKPKTNFDLQNALLDKECREFLKRYKFVLDKANNIIEETTKEYLFELFYPEAKLANIKFKNGYSFDLH
ncbi:11695_t:CDS:2, partial [Racocetra persica]